VVVNILLINKFGHDFPIFQEGISKELQSISLLLRQFKKFFLAKIFLKTHIKPML